MSLEVFQNPASAKVSGFTNAQFKKLDEIYCRAAAAKVLIYRTVDCDFDEGVASYTYYKSKFHAPALQFIIRRVGPRTSMYEVYAQGRGLVAKSGDFKRAAARLDEEVEALLKGG